MPPVGDLMTGAPTPAESVDDPPSEPIAHVAISSGFFATLGVPLLAGRDGGAGTRAFVCRNFACELPVTDPEALRQQLDA